MASCKSEDAAQPPTDTGVDSMLTIDSAVVDAQPDVPPPPVPGAAVQSKTVTTRVQTRELLFAAGEMQISGEPFARDFMGRNLDGYDRAGLPTDQYSPSGRSGDEIKDIVGFSTAVESYEYSKYHQTMVALQAYVGPSLAWGPLVNPTADSSSDEPTVRKRLAIRIGQILTSAGTDAAGYAKVPAPTTNPLNVLGFSGLHPILTPYVSFEPFINPDALVARHCTAGAGYIVASISNPVPDYECGYASLKVNDRSQLELKVSPGVMGLAAWKYSLWGIDFLSRLHDTAGNFVVRVAPGDEPKVGSPDNAIAGFDDTGSATVAGTFIGSTGLEGMWGLSMMEEMDNTAEWLLKSISTTDGTKLDGFSSVKDALAYDYGSPLRWWPTSIAVTEGAPAAWPSVASLTIDDAHSRSADLAALLLGHAMLFGMTDARNTGIAGTVGLRLTFDGAPFAADNGLPDGEATVHDRALAMLRVAFVDLDRVHTFPGTTILTDVATPKAGAIDRAAGVSTTSLAHVTIGLRQALLSLNAAITQYGGADPSPKLDDKGILNTLPTTLPAGSANFSARVRTVLIAQAAFARDVLTTADGLVANGATFDAAGKPTLDATPTKLESQTAAIRALLEGFLTTGDETYLTRARAVFRRLESDFWIPSLRFYRGERGGADAVSMTAERFAFLQSAIRETHKIAHVPGDPVLARSHLESRMGRVNKLLLNGWDDVNGDLKIQKDSECLAGRLQLGEQSLTGEFGMDATKTLVEDLDSDCVLNISGPKVASVLAGEVLFQAK